MAKKPRTAKKKTTKKAPKAVLTTKAKVVGGVELNRHNIENYGWLLSHAYIHYINQGFSLNKYCYFLQMHDMVQSKAPELDLWNNTDYDMFLDTGIQKLKMLRMTSTRMREVERKVKATTQMTCRGAILDDVERAVITQRFWGAIEFMEEDNFNYRLAVQSILMDDELIMNFKLGQLFTNRMIISMLINIDTRYLTLAVFKSYFPHTFEYYGEERITQFYDATVGEDYKELIKYYVQRGVDLSICGLSMPKAA